MKKALTKILIASILLLGFGNLNGANANDLGGFEEIFNQEEEFSCGVIDREMTQYPRYKGMIDNYFRKISTKSYDYKKRIYTSLNDLTDRKLTTINKDRQSRTYVIIGYIKCESNWRLDKLYTVNNKFYNYKIDKLGNLYAIKGYKTFFVDSSSDGKIKNIKIIDNKFLIYDWISTGGSIRKVYDINLEKNIGNVVNGENYYNKYIVGCNTIGHGPGSVQILNLETRKFRSFRKGELSVKSCNVGKGNILYFVLQNENNNENSYKYIINKDSLFVLSYGTIVDENDFPGWENLKDTFPNIYVKENKKGEFIKYIGAGVEARQNKLYTYFYYNGELINTVKNKIKNDYELILGYSMELVDTEDYLSSYYAKKKLDLYSATLENNGERILFVKKIDNGEINFAYNLKTEKLEHFN